MRPIEYIWLGLGTGMLIANQLPGSSFTTQDLGAVVLFYGLFAAAWADRTGQRGPIEFIRAVGGLLGGRGGGDTR